MHARSENLHDGARSAPEIFAIFMNRRANSSYFHEALLSTVYCLLYASDLSRRSMHGKMAGRERPQPFAHAFAQPFPEPLPAQ